MSSGSAVAGMPSRSMAFHHFWPTPSGPGPDSLVGAAGQLHSVQPSVIPNSQPGACSLDLLAVPTDCRACGAVRGRQPVSLEAWIGVHPCCLAAAV